MTPRAAAEDVTSLVVARQAGHQQQQQQQQQKHQQQQHRQRWCLQADARGVCAILLLREQSPRVQLAKKRFRGRKRLQRHRIQKQQQQQQIFAAAAQFFSLFVQLLLTSRRRVQGRLPLSHCPHAQMPSTRTRQRF